MNIWDWVVRSAEEARKAGRDRLAELILRVPQWATDDDHAQLDAVMPEALALAREAKNPWLEVYFRHWNLQSRILHRLEVTEWMGEAARLLDFAHSDAAKGCPQSVCVTQDFASCFGHLDGPAYVEERLGAARETLARIDATWPCFTCISTECAAALADGGRVEESLAFVEAQEGALVAAGLGRLRQRFLSTKLDSFLELGRPKEALELLATSGEPSDENERRELAIHQARALCHLDRAAEAREVLPSADEIRPSLNLYRLWAEAARLLAERGAMDNDWALDRTLLEMEEALSRNGAARKAFDLAHERARLAMRREARGSALHACARMEALVPRLRRPLGADEALARMRAEALALPPPTVELPETPARLLEEFEGGPEQALDAFAAARARWPEHEGLVLAEGAVLETLGRAAEAEEGLRAHLTRAPDALQVLGRLAELYLERRRLAALRALMADLLGRPAHDGARAMARWFLAQAALAEEQRDEAKAHLRALLEADPDSLQATVRLCALERETGEAEAALARLDAAVKRWPDAGPHDWERMVVGTLLERWEPVRDSAARLGVAVPGETGPLHEEDGPLCRIRLVEASGEVSELYAEQTGPVTARVLSIALPGYPQHTGDEVVFTVPPLNPPPATSEEEARHTWLYPAVAVKRPGNQFVFELEGAHPGAEALEALRSLLRFLGARLSVRSDDQYRLPSPRPDEREDGLELKGLYALVAVPPEAELARVEALLSEAAGAWEHPLLWRGLLRKLGRDEALARQQELAERYGLEG